MTRIAAIVPAEAATPEVEALDAGTRVTSGCLTQHADAASDLPSQMPTNRLDLRDLKTHLAERKAQRLAR